ncbi:uncharacterized protein LOC129315066 isoform X2 [Prosopis cineraria]|uniref:uncharacterized protein LOC129315066 isoform X2 n=1 Tax=Prosopis cineraria TaxID=364024 RepID=UPI00240EBA6E|nr:uncharacterized protein LOC129315066 isoform X2 [Prosopis cineraria]
MKSQEPKDIIHKKIAWTIGNFSSLKTKTEHVSEVFMAAGCAWRLCMYKGRLDRKSLAIFLEVADALSLPQGWSINTACTIIVVNQVYSKNSKKAGTQALVPKDDDVTEFKDLGLIQKALVPLLEEACSWHPSLMDYKQKGSRKFTEWAFTALGRVLQFLKNKKWKDMNENACEELQYLLEELEMSRLDLKWLEPLVKSALNMKGYAEKVETMKRLKQNLVVLEIEMNKTKEKLANKEENVEMIRKELVNAEDNFEEKDLDAKIGYGKS